MNGSWFGTFRFTFEGTTWLFSNYSFPNCFIWTTNFLFFKLFRVGTLQKLINIFKVTNRRRFALERSLPGNVYHRQKVLILKVTIRNWIYDLNKIAHMNNLRNRSQSNELETLILNRVWNLTLCNFDWKCHWPVSFIFRTNKKSFQNVLVPSLLLYFKLAFTYT